MTNSKWRNTLLMLVIIFVFIALMVNGRRKKSKNKRRYSSIKDAATDTRDIRNFVLVEGDIFLGTLMQIHSGGRDGVCRNLSHSAMMELEALLYSVDMVNVHISLLPGIKLGIYIRDSCADPDYALKQALTIMEGRYSESPRWSYRCPDGRIAESVLPQITGLITSIESPAANVQAASLLQLFRLPQINAKSRSPLLRTIGRFPYLHHSVPSYFQQLSVVMEVLRYFHWTYIHVIFEDSEYGSLLSYKLQEILQHNGICIANTIMIQSTIFTKGRKQMFDMIATRLVQHRYARGVVIVTENDRTVPQLLAAVKRIAGSKRLAFFGLGWGKKVKTQNIEEVLEGSLVLQLISTKVASLKEYITQLTPAKNERNPWFIEFWEEVFNCKFPTNIYSNQTQLNVTHGKHLCSGKENLSQYITSLGEDTEHISNAVMAFSQTLHDIHWEYCHGKPGLCDAMKQMTGEELSRYLEKVRFKTLSGQEFEFHSQREPKSFYRLLNYQQTEPGIWKWVNLGISKHNFKNSTLALVKFRVQEPRFPPSFCSLPCEPGEMKTFRVKDSCCWVCVPCPPGHYLPEETRCDACPSGTEPNFDRRRCVPVSPSSRKSASAAERREPTNSTAEKVEQDMLNSDLKSQDSLSGGKKKKRKQSFKSREKESSVKKKQQFNKTTEAEVNINGTSESELLVNSTFKNNSTLMAKGIKEEDHKEADLVSDKQDNLTDKLVETNIKRQATKSEREAPDFEESDKQINITKESSKKQEEASNLLKDESRNKLIGKKLPLQRPSKKAKDSDEDEKQSNSTAKRKIIHQVSVSDRKRKSALEFHYGVTVSPIDFYYTEERRKTTVSRSLVNISNSERNRTDKMRIENNL